MFIDDLKIKKAFQNIPFILSFTEFNLTNDEILKLERDPTNKCANMVFPIQGGSRKKFIKNLLKKNMKKRR